MWDLPRQGIKPTSLTLQGGFLTTGPAGKPQFPNFIYEGTKSQRREGTCLRPSSQRGTELGSSSSLIPVQPYLYPKMLFQCHVYPFPSTQSALSKASNSLNHQILDWPKSSIRFFSFTSYGKTQANFLAHPIQWSVLSPHLMGQCHEQNTPHRTSLSTHCRVSLRSSDLQPLFPGELPLRLSKASPPQ